MFYGKRLYLVIFTALALTSCSYLPDWLGAEKNEPKIAGKRVSVLANADTASASASEDAVSAPDVTIPRPVLNNNWFKSDGIAKDIPQNIELPRKLVYKYSIGTGSSSSGARVLATPIIAENMVYVLTSSGFIKAYNAKNVRSIKWVTDLGKGSKEHNVSGAGGITYSDGVIYATTGTENVFALDAKTGKIIWSRNLSSLLRSAPEVASGKVFVNSVENKLYALDSKSSDILWSHTTTAEDISMYGTAAPVVSDNMATDNIVLAPYSSGDIYALNVNDGSEIWSDSYRRNVLGYDKSLADIDATPIVKDSIAYIISNDGVFKAADVKTGKPLWQKPLAARQNPWLAGDFIYVLNNNQEVSAVYTKTGAVKWTRNLPNKQKRGFSSSDVRWSGPVLAGDWLWLVSSAGKLVAISPLDGSNQYERNVPSDISIPPIVAGGKVYLYSDDGELIMLSEKSLWE